MSSPNPVNIQWRSRIRRLVVTVLAVVLLASSLPFAHDLGGSLLLLAGVAVLATQAVVDLRTGRLALPDPVLLPLAAAGIGFHLGHAPAGGSALLDHPVMATILACLPAAAIILLSAMRQPLTRASRVRNAVVANLPAVADSRLPKNQLPAAVGGLLAALVVGAVVVLFDGPALIWALAVLLGLVPTALLALRALTTLRHLHGRRRQVAEALEAYQPRFVVYTSRPDDASYQIAMWLPHLQESGERFVVATRSPIPAEALAGLTDVPVIEARQTGDVESLLVSSLRAAFYVNASSGNGALVRHTGLTHVYLGHGDSDKPPSYNPTHAMYDKVFAAGPAATRRYAEHGVAIPPEKFEVVGRPQVADVIRATRPIAEISEPVVLYAPTWRGHVEETMLYSLPAGEQIVTALLRRGSTVVFRPHPFNADFEDDRATVARIQELLRSDAVTTGRAHRWGAAAETDLTFLDCINVSDAMVSDVSAVVSDFLFSGKPYAMIAVPSAPDQFVRDFPVARGSYVVSGDLSDLEPALDSLLGADPAAGRRAEIRADYLGDFTDREYRGAFAAAVRAVCAGQAGIDEEMDDDAAGGEPAGDDMAGEDRAAGEAVALDADAGEPGESVEAGESVQAGEAVEAGETVEAGEADAPAFAFLGIRAAAFRRLQRVALPVSATAVAVLAWSLAVLGRTDGTMVVDWAAVVGLVIAVALWLLSVRRPNRGAPARELTTQERAARRRAAGNRLIGRGLSTRLMIGLTAVSLLDAHMLLSRPVGVTVTVVLCLLPVLESSVRGSFGQVGLMVSGLPGLRVSVAEPLPRGLIPIGGLVVALLIALYADVSITTSGSVPGLGLLLVLALLLLAATVQIAAAGLVRARRTLLAEPALADALRAYCPEFVAYFASNVGAGYQLGMWLPYLERIGRPYMVVTRTARMQQEITRLVESSGLSVPVIFRPTLRSVEDVVVPSLRAAFYVNNAVRNTHLIERRELTHVWLNHGDSEKPACFNPVHAIYDLIFTAGQAGIDRYARHGVTIPREKFVIAGRPQVEVIEPPRPSIDEGVATVLYAPTWQGPYADSRVYSLPLGEQIVEHLLERGVRVVFRAHPFNYRYRDCVAMINQIGARLDADRAATGRQHLWGQAAERELSIEQCFNLSDAMISDVSAVVSDYLKSDKPFSIVSVGRTPEQLVLDAPAAAAAYVLREDLSNLAEVCEQLLVSDPMAAERHATKVYYLGDFDDRAYAEGFLGAARAVIDGHSTAGVPA